MQRGMLELFVETDDGGRIIISQQGTEMDAMMKVVVSIDQVDTLISWLQDAKEEVLQEIDEENSESTDDPNFVSSPSASSGE